jgi:predicted phosphodiesterase
MAGQRIEETFKLKPAGCRSDPDQRKSLAGWARVTYHQQAVFMKNNTMYLLRSLTAACSVFLALALSAQAESTNFSFVQLSDTHFGPARENRNSKEILKKINSLPVPVEFVAHTGDVFSDCVTNQSVVNIATSALFSLRAPLHVVAGNHDIRTQYLERTTQAFTNLFGALSFRAEYRGVVCLFLYTEPLSRGFDMPGYDPLAWLEAQLKEADGKPVLIFHHMPTVADFHNNTMHKGWPQAARSRWEKLISNSNVKAVIAGHFHRGELHWSGEVPQYVGEAAAAFWGRTPAFRLYEYRDGRLGYRTIYLESSGESADKTLKKTAP